MNHENIGFWGKIQVGGDGQVEKWLSLTQHCLDVAHVFSALVKLPLIQRKLDAAAGVILDEVQCQRLSVIALLHDIGKANLGFQDKAFDQRIHAGHIRELAPFFAEPDLQERLIQAVEAETLCCWFDPPESVQAFFVASWSHHGKPQAFQDSQAANQKTIARFWQPEGRRDPLQAIADLLQAAKTAFPNAFAGNTQPIPATPALQHRFAGMVMLADWLGSHRGFFPLQTLGEPAPLRTPRDAAHALRSVGLDPRDWQAKLEGSNADFRERFGFEPRALQARLDSLSTTGAEQNKLLIAEAETGSGKTEAALARFFRLFAAGQVDGLYFALPTRVAARELYQRVYAAIARLFPNPDNRPPTLLAVPGYARIDNAPVNVNTLLPEDETRYEDDEDQARRERLWAAEHPKRFLACTVAVGTIDQALLSALQTPHAHLRSVCLDRNLLVVDEVHASDPYMRRLLQGLLRHHLGLGGHALLLSATLGSRARAAFTQTAEPGYVDAIAEPYPALTDAGGVPQVLPGDSAHPKKVCVELQPCLEKPESLLPEIAAALKAGARVLVVLNTVGRAIALQRAAEANAEIEPVMFRCAGIVAPHHGRFAPVDRELLDQAVTDALGKHSKLSPSGSDGSAFSRAESLPETGCSDGPMERRHLVGIAGGDAGAPADNDSWVGQGEAPLRALLLIGTQTLEQSLDIDADLLITDLCPMDVLLQRIGRLHRHAERSRPPGFRQARCILLVPETGDLESLLDAKGEAGATARKAGLGSVYPDMRVLQLTRDLLAEKSNIEIPRDNRRLVEGATHGEKLATLASERWDRHGREMEGGDLAKGIRAHYAGLTEIYQLSFGDVECQFRENEEARTRLGLDALRIPLERTVKSPFGQPLAEIIIPGHLADKKATAKQVAIIAEKQDAILLAYGAHRYRYSRHGLEKLDG